MNLTYRPHAQIDELAENECTLHRAGDARGARWWMLWFNVRNVLGALEEFAIAVAPGGTFSEHGPGGRTWGLTPAGGGVWAIDQSVNVVDHKTVLVKTGEECVERVLVPGPAPDEPHVTPVLHSSWTSIWHEDVTIVGVPDGEPWIPAPAVDP